MNKKEGFIKKEFSKIFSSKASKKGDKQKVLEVASGKPRQEEERFYEHFSTVQMNAVLLLILASTFLTTGLTKYAEIIGQTQLINRWLILIIFSIILLVMSVISIALSGVLLKLKDKRIANTLAFSLFLFGASVFFVSLIILVAYLL